MEPIGPRATSNHAMGTGLRFRSPVVVVVVGLALVVAGCGAGATSSPSSTGTIAVTSAPPASVGAGDGEPSTSVAPTVTRPPGGGSATSAPSPTSTSPTSTSPTSAPQPSGTGVLGTVSAGPTCPVERADQPCPPRPVVAHIDAKDSSGRTVASTDSDSSGRFAFTLAPGSYTLETSTGAVYPRCPPTSVTVTAGAPARADIACDSGIR